MLDGFFLVAENSFLSVHTNFPLSRSRHIYATFHICCTRLFVFLSLVLYAAEHRSFHNLKYLIGISSWTVF